MNVIVIKSGTYIDGGDYTCILKTPCTCILCTCCMPQNIE